MALSANLFRKANRTFSKHPKNMADSLRWESISMSIRSLDNPPSPEAEVHVQVVISIKLIKIEYVHVRFTLDRNDCIDFSSIEEISSPTVDSVNLVLHGGEEVTFKFGTAKSKAEFFQAIKIESSDPRNSEKSKSENSEESNT